MKSDSLFDLRSHLRNRRLEQVVENRTAYTLDTAELNIYETHSQARAVELTFHSPVLTSMIRGKKVMHLEDTPDFDYHPGESVLVPGNRTMRIDFPEATFSTPTQCLALAIGQDQIAKYTDLLNENIPLVDSPSGWRWSDSSFYFTNSSTVNSLISRLIDIFTENNPAKDFFADLVMKELTMRLIQTQARRLLIENSQQHSSTNRLAFITQYIKDHLHETFNVRQLADKACMSEPSFYRQFKAQFGLSPLEFINQQRIQLAQRLLKTTNRSVGDISVACGFNNLNHFLKLFKRYTQSTPVQYRLN
ncbi:MULTISPECIES: AraC family transcriptional regulator [unclassified Siphonobacter]|uniref:AraC family transcriptional regulator n=1 Tax=unclassified Siphonobacter TaxID=2635712 RepID=UPI000CBDA26B|nr:MULTISPECIES: AraC family transcriptional regulator [unclassified Siphonobacter]MDQ1088253.1 AraC family transcriptional regulator [Siphonobacter sp. SORGH_AS_1065]MDR6194399.1 AraC family transcriptional regulator [Siphonobacter sp. SORGH_AS_0500]PKK37699.1 AraC family transcriptional regulator [Siphonobacter sp. SORGH_AS_0500]